MALNGIISTGKDDQVELVTKRGWSFKSKITDDKYVSGGLKILPLSHQPAKQIKKRKNWKGLLIFYFSSFLPISPPNGFPSPRRDQLIYKPGTV